MDFSPHLNLCNNFDSFCSVLYFHSSCNIWFWKDFFSSLSLTHTIFAFFFVLCSSRAFKEKKKWGIQTDPKSKNFMIKVSCASFSFFQCTLLALNSNKSIWSLHRERVRDWIKIEKRNNKKWVFIRFTWSTKWFFM